MEKYDLVVIGAGIHGLPVAKTYLEIHPSDHVLILDAGRTVGGTWSFERIYDGLVTNNLVGTIGFSDFPMDYESFGVKPGSHIPGIVMHKYLTAYAERFGVFDKITFEAIVKSAELKEDKTWTIRYEKRTGEQVDEREIMAKKLVMATGTTSEPHMPDIRGAANFGGQILHTREMSSKIGGMNSADNIVVLGGSKSAVDAVYMSATKGKHVDWIIQASGRGASWLTGPFVSPINLQFETLVTRRIMSWCSPSVDSDGYHLIRKFLHNTSIGRAFLRTFFGIINNDVIERSKYHDHPETKKLIPKNGIAWCGTAFSIFNYPTEFFDLFHEGLINIHMADIDYLSPQTVHLSGGQSIKAGVLICATGWKITPTISILPENLTDKDGISHASCSDPDVAAADEEILRRFPEFEDSPMKRRRDAILSGKPDKSIEERPSWVLYRGLIPPHFLAFRNLAYCGMSICLRGCLLAEIQALWISALFDDRLLTPIPNEDKAAKQALLQNRFYQWRAPCGMGDRSVDMVFEIMPYIDTLLRDLGLETKRKGGLGEIFGSYAVSDYKGLIGEWLGKQSSAEVRAGTK